MRDSLTVMRLQRAGLSLDLEEQLTHPRSPLRSVFFDSILSPRSGPTTFILNQTDDNGLQQGLVQVRIRPGRPERVVVFMSPQLDSGSGVHATWQRLLNHVCVQTAQWGSLRIYARLPASDQTSQLFKNVGFMDYGQEDVYQLEANIKRGGLHTNLMLRPQQASDGWGLQKLYASLTPRAVQNAEGLAQGQWELSPRRWGEQGRRYGYVWEFRGDIMGALHLRAGKKGYWIRTLLHPDALDQAADLCRAALQLTTVKANLPVYFAVRQYEAGWRNVLPALGFTALTSQTLMVKPMTVRVRETKPMVMPSLESSQPESPAASITAQTARPSHAPYRLPAPDDPDDNDSPVRIKVINRITNGTKARKL